MKLTKAGIAAGIAPFAALAIAAPALASPAPCHRRFFGCDGGSDSPTSIAECGFRTEIYHPRAISVTVTSGPSQGVYVAWDLNCGNSHQFKDASGSLTAGTPMSFTLPLPIAHPTACGFGVAAHTDGYGSVHIRAVVTG